MWFHSSTCSWKDNEIFLVQNFSNSYWSWGINRYRRQWSFCGMYTARLHIPDIIRANTNMTLFSVHAPRKVQANNVQWSQEQTIQLYLQFYLHFQIHQFAIISNQKIDLSILCLRNDPKLVFLWLRYNMEKFFINSFSSFDRWIQWTMWIWR